MKGSGSLVSSLRGFRWASIIIIGMVGSRAT